MPVNVTVTKREVKNKTGIDVSVGSYDPAPTPKQVKNYHVVVITSLPFFKLPQHGEADVVHFMVRRDYAAFEKFQKDILIAFPDLKLPPLPRKFHVFMNETDIEERMVSFDCIMKVIARHKTMCTSPPMLEFLGFSLIADKNYFKARREYLQKKDEEAVDQKKKKELVYGDRLDDIDRGLFGTGTASSEEPFSDDSQTKNQPFTADSIFEDMTEEEKHVRKSAKISTLKDEDRDLFIPGGSKSDAHSENQSSLLNELEDNSELLSVSDTLDDVLKITDKKKTTKKISPMTNSGAKGLFEVEEDSNNAADMDGGDIMKYIQQNTDGTEDDDLDLF